MRKVVPAVLALLLLTLFAGCIDDRPILDLDDATLSEHLPAAEVLDGLVVMQNTRPHEGWFTAYAMETNPGHANASRFTNVDSVIPESAYGEMFYHPDDPSSVLVAFAYAFKDNAHLDTYLKDDVCETIIAGRHYLRHGNLLTQVVIDSPDEHLRAELVSSSNAAAADIMERTGAEELCS